MVDAATNVEMEYRETAIARWFDKNILGRPWLVAMFLAALTIFFGFHAQNYKVDASADSLVLEGDEDLEFYRGVMQRYNSADFLIVAYQPKAELLADESLAALDKLVADLTAINGVASVLSLLDVPLLYSPKVSVTALSNGIQTLRDPGVDRNMVSAELRDSPIYRQLLTSIEGDTAALQINLTRDEKYIELLSARENLRQKQSSGELDAASQRQLREAEQAFKAYSTIAAENQQQLVANVRTTLTAHRAGAKKMYLGGVAMIANDMVQFVKSDLQTFGLGILAFIIVLLTVIFRSLRWVILPLTACLLTNIFMLGLLGLLDWRMTVISSNFVALLLIITLAVAVHLIVRYRELQVQHPADSQRQLALKTVSFMLRPCLYTALTTIIAFMSLVISGIRPIIDFGWMMTVGVTVALCLTFIVVPVGMVLGKAPPNAGDGSNQRAGDEAVFTRKFAMLTEKYGGWVIGVALFIALFAVSGLTRLKVENRFIDYFDEGTEIYQGMELIDSELGGTVPLDIILFADARTADPAAVLAASDAGRSSEFVSDDSARDVDEFAEDQIAGSGAALDEFAEDEFSDEFGDDDFDDEGFDDFDGEFDQDGAAGEQQSEWFTRSGLQRVSAIHQHLDSLEETGKVLSLATIYQVAKDLLDGGIDDIQLTFAYKGLPEDIKISMIDPYLNNEFDEARINVRVKETSRTLNRAELLENLHGFMQKELGYTTDQYRFTGMLVLYNNMLQSLFRSQILTLGVVFIAITIMLAVLFQSIKLAFIGIVPNMLAALMVLGGMGWAGLPLDMMTITIAAISIGIGVDNTIHYVHRFKKEFPTDRNYHNTMYRCHGSIGRAMYYTSITIIFGFSILALSNFKPSIYFGLLTGVAMISALLGSLLLLPRLLVLLKPLGPDQPSATVEV